MLPSSMFELRDETRGVITLAQNFEYSLLGTDGKFSIIVEAFQVTNQERKSRCEVIITYAVDLLAPVFKENLYQTTISNPKVIF
jgi:hypothetical protein